MANQTSIGTLPLSAANGGLGVSSPTAHGILVAEGSSAATTKVLTNGQVLIGSTGADPVAATLGGGTNITVTGGAGTASIAVSGQIAIGNGGTGQATKTAGFDALSPTTTNGDLIYNNGTNNVRLGIGSNTQILTVSGGVPTWAANASSASQTNLLAGGYISLNPWYEGTSFASIADGAHFADVWVYNKNGTMVDTVTQDTSIFPSVSTIGHYDAVTAKFAVTTAQASISAGNYQIARIPMEGYNFNGIAQQAFTAFVPVYSSKTGTFCVSFRNSGTDRSYVAECVILAANTWQLFTINVPASPSAGTWNYTNGVGLQMSVARACGSTFQTTAGSWQTGNFFATSNQTNFVDSTSNVFYIGDVSIAQGSVSSVLPYPVRQAQGDLFRYIERLGGNISNEWISVMGVLTSSTDSAHQLSYMYKRAIPTITFGSAGNFSVSSNAVNTTSSSISASNISFNTARVGCVFSSVGAITNNTGLQLTANSTSGTVLVDARLI